MRCVFFRVPPGGVHLHTWGVGTWTFHVPTGGRGVAGETDHPQTRRMPAAEGGPPGAQRLSLTLTHSSTISHFRHPPADPRWRFIGGAGTQGKQRRQDAAWHEMGAVLHVPKGTRNVRRWSRQQNKGQRGTEKRVWLHLKIVYVIFTKLFSAKFRQN